MTKTRKNIKTVFKKRSGKGVAASELIKMMPIFAAGDLILAVAGVIWCLAAGHFDYKIFTGIIAGSAVSAGYFYTLGAGTESALIKKNDKKARFSANMWYGVRYAGLFVILAFLLIINVINVFTAVIPLFFPRIYYFFILFKKEN